MPQYRYHRMARNLFNWTQPHSGRLGLTRDYVGLNGFGLEDWNFTRDICADGRHHLYLQAPPANTDREDVFNIALCALEADGYWLIGLVNNAKYCANAKFSPKTMHQRAKQLQKLDEDNNLGSSWNNTTLQYKIEELPKHSPNIWVSVKPEDLVILEQPFLIPHQITNPLAARYTLNNLSEDQFTNLTQLANTERHAEASVRLFPEGTLRERRHRYRERNSQLTARAKQRFIDIHGALHCEACNWKPEQTYHLGNLTKPIIEAHHNIPLSDTAHAGQTRIDDLKMLCPNCHRAIHTIQPWTSVEDFKDNIVKST